MKEEQHYHECISSELARKPGLLGWIDANLEKPLLVVGMLSIILFITYQTALRNVVAYINDASKASWLKDTLTYLMDSVLGLSHSASWAEESSRYIFIAISYLAIPVAIKCRSNIRVDVFYDKFSHMWCQIKAQFRNEIPCKICLPIHTQYSMTANVDMNAHLLFLFHPIAFLLFLHITP